MTTQRVTRKGRRKPAHPRTTLEQKLELKSEHLDQSLIGEAAGKRKKVGNSETRKAVYMFFNNEMSPYNQTTPYNHTLYAVDLPDNLEDASVDSRPAKLYPVLTFKNMEYPENMSCVALEGKLFFFGGDIVSWRLKIDDFYLLDVHIFDPLTASFDEPLIKGPKMNTGKCNPFAFGVGRDVYVLGKRKLDYQSRFEVLRADASGQYAKWEVLEEPPFSDAYIQGHVVKGERLILSGDYQYYVYETVSCIWSCANGYDYNFWNRAYFVDGHLFTCPTPYTVSFYKQYRSKKDKVPLPGALWSLRIHDKSNPVVMPMSSLTHIEERCFCHVFFGTPVSRSLPKQRDPKNHFLGLTIFKASKETYSDDQKRTYFKADLLHSMHFANKNTATCDYFIQDCFVLPSCGIKQPVEDMVLTGLASAKN